MSPADVNQVHLRANVLFRPPDGTDQPEGWIVGNPLDVVEVFVARRATVDRLPKQINKRELGIRPPAMNRQMLFDQLSQAQPLIEFVREDQSPYQREC